ncbi:hypothetical protein G6F56_000832 [Rhizopus delemar]|nr:hypothetical protein G6F56_000832 [Rhizopus delemar]
MSTLFRRAFTFLNNTKLPKIRRVPKIVEEEGDDVEDFKQLEIDLMGLRENPDITVWQAAETGNRAALQYFIENSEDRSSLLNARDPDTNCTLLHMVIINAKQHKSPVLPLLRLLLKNGADARLCGMYSAQAIHMIPVHCLDQPVACLELLLKYKADVNARDGDGWTPLHYAARFCENPEPVVHMLISRGAQVNACDVHKKTPLFVLMANNNDHADLLYWLIHTAKADLSILGYYCDPYTQEARAGSLVFQAAKYNRPGCLAVLIHSAIETLCKVITQDEVTAAGNYVQGHPAMVHLLHELQISLESNYESPMYNYGLYAERRRPSMMTVLGLVGPSSHGNKLFRKANKFMRRTKSHKI